MPRYRCSQLYNATRKLVFELAVVNFINESPKFYLAEGDFCFEGMVMAETKAVVTVEGKRKLEAELKHLLSVERPSILLAIETAIAQGDLKENADYHAAKERQSFAEGRIQYLSGVVTSAEVIDPSQLRYEHIVFGATVALEDLDSGNKVKYQIVGVDEADIAKQKISIGSPIAKALIGKRKGDEVQVITPKGKITFEVQSVEYR